MTDQTTDKPTGLRRVILDAIQGIDPCDYCLFSRASGDGPHLHAQLETAGYITDGPDYSCAPGSPPFAWSRQKLAEAATDELLAIYDQLRPGVLDALGRGE